MVSANWASSHRPLGLMLFFETFPTPHLKCSHGFHTRLVILFTCSCQHQADAWQRLMFGKLPATICLQLMRFSSTGKKLQNMVKYDDMLQLCEIQSPGKCQSIKISRVSYELAHWRQAFLWSLCVLYEGKWVLVLCR